MSCQVGSSLSLYIYIYRVLWVGKGCEGALCEGALPGQHSPSRPQVFRIGGSYIFICFNNILYVCLHTYIYIYTHVYLLIANI